MKGLNHRCCGKNKMVWWVCKISGHDTGILYQLGASLGRKSR